VASQPRGREIHLIAENLSAHKTGRVTAFLAAHPNVTLHDTPTYSSWLNQIERWFSKLKRDVLARGIFTSVTDLARKLRRYIEQYNRRAKPVRWSYSDPTRRIA
jgi:transposase